MIATNIKKLISTLQDAHERDLEIIRTTEKIHVNTMISKLAFFYEKIRNTLEYGDEQLIRKNAIQRILKRRLIDDTTGTDVSRYLINELIRGGYVEDNSIPDIKVHHVAQIINKYIIFRNDFIGRFTKKQLKVLSNWTLGLMACEIEETLVSSWRENAYIEALYRFVEPLIKLRDQKLISKHDLGLQIYIAVVRLLMKSDNTMLSYRLLKLNYPEWKNPDKAYILNLSGQANSIRVLFETQLQHKIGSYLQKYIRPFAIRFRILEPTIQENFSNIDDLIIQRENFKSEIRKVCNGYYKKIRGKLRRSVVRSILYIFITKMVLAFILEMPFDVYYHGKIEFIPLYINIIFPPLLLFLITMTVRPPQSVNTENIVTGLEEMIYSDAKNDTIICEIKKSYVRNPILDTIFRGMYGVTFLISYGVLIWGLYRFGFNIVSGCLFLFFLSLISYFGIRVRRLAKEYVVVGRKENALTFLLDIFSYPIIRVGQWISDKSSKINVFIFILDVIIEAPFKTLIEVFDQWSQFIKEKRDEIL